MIKHVWQEGVYEPKSDIKKRLESFGIDTRMHDFLFPHLVVYDTEASLPPATTEPAAKRAKICADVNRTKLNEN